MPPPSAPATHLTAILRWLSLAMTPYGTTGRLALPLIALIANRLLRISQRFAALAARIRAGRYTPRPAAPRGAVSQRRTIPRDPLPRTLGWLPKLVPEAMQARAQFEHLLRDPEMAALLAAAPGPMGRVLRPLCRMFGFTPPPILARPAPPAAPSTRPEPAPPPSPPEASRPAPARSPSPAACGPPLPA